VSTEVTVAIAADPVEADDIRGLLRAAGIETRLEAAELEGAGPLMDGPCRVLVADSLLERALEVLEAADDDDDDEDDVE
jgi:Putative prokaryotic signal transducing protein